MTSPAATALLATRRGRSLTRRLIGLTAVVVLGPPLLLLLVLSGITDAAPVGTGPTGGPPIGPEPATLAASDAAQVAAVPADLRDDFLAAARAYALPPALLAAVGHIESGFDPTAVGPPVPGGPALGMMQFLPSSWTEFNAVPGATEFDPGPAVVAAARHLLSSGAQPGGAFDAAAGLFGYNHSSTYVADVLAVAASYGYSYSPDGGPPDDPVRYHQPLPGAIVTPDPAGGPAVLTAPAGTAPVACVRAAVVSITAANAANNAATTGSAATAGPAITVVLRGEDGFLYSYAGLTQLAAGIRPGAVVEPGTPLGAATTNPIPNTATGAHAGATDAEGESTVTFGIRRTGDSPWTDPVPYLATWPGNDGSGR